MLMKSSDRSSRERYSDEELAAILDAAINTMASERSSSTLVGGSVNTGLVELDLPESLVIIGDLHGDIFTLAKILNRIDSNSFLANPRNKLVFLGDYVDRGRHSIDVIFTLLDLKSRYPNSIILMRGNHEAWIQFPFASHTLRSEMEKEVVDGAKLYTKLTSIFDLLTLATIVRERVLLVHGGVPRITFGCDSKQVLAHAQTDKRILEEILWNDPRDLGSDLQWEKSRRSFGYHFGESVSAAWLSTLGAKVMIRSHEPCQGFKISHHDKVITLFSCQESYPSFKPAYIQVSKRDLQTANTPRALADHINWLN